MSNTPYDTEQQIAFVAQHAPIILAMSGELPGSEAARIELTARAIAMAETMFLRLITYRDQIRGG